jgi:hypothetical protein
VSESGTVAYSLSAPRDGRAEWTLLVLALSTAACSPPAAPEVAFSATPPPVSSSRSVAQESAPPPTEPSPPCDCTAPTYVSSAPSDRSVALPGQIHCGESLCSVKTELCCGEIGRDARFAGQCRPRRDPPRQPAPGAPTTRDEETCGGPSRTLYCDSSNDCAAGETCCRSDSATYCRPNHGRTPKPCDISEPCDGPSCLTPSTTCIDHECRRPGHLTCGYTQCNDEFPACCYDKRMSRYFCASSRAGCLEQKDGRALTCLTRSDCPTGAHCCNDPSVGTTCQADCGPMGGALCTSDADCEGTYVVVAEGERAYTEKCSVSSEEEDLTLRTCTMRWDE